MPLKFVTFEGGEGGGKSTQLRLIAETLRATGATVVTTREPGGAPGAEEIRKLLVEGEPGRWPAEAEALLHFAARAEHLHTVIRPALDRGDYRPGDSADHVQIASLNATGIVTRSS